MLYSFKILYYLFITENYDFIMIIHFALLLIDYSTILIHYFRILISITFSNTFNYHFHAILFLSIILLFHENSLSFIIAIFIIKPEFFQFFYLTN